MKKVFIALLLTANLARCETAFRFDNDISPSRDFITAIALGSVFLKGLFDKKPFINASTRVRATRLNTHLSEA